MDVNGLPAHLLYGVRKGETRLYMEELLCAHPSAIRINAVSRAAQLDGWHHLRVAHYDPRDKPDFIKAIA